MAPSPDSSSSEYQSLENSQHNAAGVPPPAPETQQRPSLLSRLFRRSGRQKTRQIDSYSAQFPPTEWFNSRTVHLHNVGTQTNDQVRETRQAVVFIVNVYKKVDQRITNLSIASRTCPCRRCCPIRTATDRRSANNRQHCRGAIEGTFLASPRS